MSERKMSARLQNFEVSILENGSVEVYVADGGNKPLLRDLAEQAGFRLQENWNTRQCGKYLVEFVNPSAKEAVIGNFLVSVKEDGGIDITVANGKTKHVLRQLAETVGFEYQEDWNTRQFGKFLIDLLEI